MVVASAAGKFRARKACSGVKKSSGVSETVSGEIFGEVSEWLPRAQRANLGHARRAPA